MIDGEAILMETNGPIGKLTCNRPKVLNAYNKAISEQLIKGLDELTSADTIKVIVISSAGKAFMAGADINMLNGWAAQGDAGKIRTSMNSMLDPNMLENCPKLTIAAVNGLAFGMGCEVALACDYRFASQTAQFALPEIKLGIIPGCGGSQRMLRLAGATKALEMISTGDPIDVDEAHRIGILNQVVEPDDLWKSVEIFASRLTEKSVLALKTAKKLIYRGGELPMYQGIAYEQDRFCESLLTEDAAEGTRAFP